ncbi:hypothetical protein Dimus_025467 [Dionaea muscipula]
MLQQARRLDHLREGVLDSFCLVISSFMRGIKVGHPCTPMALAGMSGGTSQEQDPISTSDMETCWSNVQWTPEIEKTYVHRVYNAIAPHFSSTRFAKWPKVAAFLGSLPVGSLVLDAGCGNGKYLGLNPQCFFIGCDISSPLVGICADRGHEVVVADAVNLPYRTGFGDAAISIAVLHHLSTENRRRRAIEELVRVVKKGGLVLITVWAVEQEDRSLVGKWTPLTQKYLEEWVGPSSTCSRISSPSPSPSPSNLQSISEGEDGDFQESSSNEMTHGNSKEPVQQTPNLMTTNPFGSSGSNEVKESQHEYFVPWHLPYHRAEVSGVSASALQNGLARRDDKKGAVVYNRYYHVFSQGELERLVSEMGNTRIVDQFFDKSNWCIVLEKSK